MVLWVRTVLLCLAVSLAACGDDDGGGGSNNPDGGMALDDSGMSGDGDAMSDAMGSGTLTPTQAVNAVRNAADGSGLSLPVTGVTVTYLKPAVGSLGPSFTVQVAQTGPGLLILIDPATLSPVPAVGDVIRFTVTEVETFDGQPRVLDLTDYARDSQGGSIASLVQNVTAATNLVSAGGAYDSEVVDVTATVTGAFTAAGTGWESAPLATTGVDSSQLVVRLPSADRNAREIVPGCSFTLDNIPVSGYDSETRLEVYAMSELTLNSCPAPTVVSAVATSPTAVQVTFSRNIEAASVMANGSQFTFNNGLTASAASVTGRVVTVTTSAQVPGTMYTVSVTNTVTDQLGTGVAGTTTANFAGYIQYAVVRINEINANMGLNCDLVELRVISDGTLNGYTLRDRDNTALVTFTNLDVVKNDIIVVHLNSTQATCNPGTSLNETTITQYPASMYSNNYDTALDWYSTTIGIASTDNVLVVRNQLGTIVEAVLIDDDSGNLNISASSEMQAANVVAASQWQRAIGGVPAGGFVLGDFRANAVLDSDATGSTRTSNTLQRINNGDTNSEADWDVAPIAHTWGLINAGQSAL